MWFWWDWLSGSSFKAQKSQTNPASFTNCTKLGHITKGSLLITTPGKPQCRAKWIASWRLLARTSPVGKRLDSWGTWRGIHFVCAKRVCIVRAEGGEYYVSVPTMFLNGCEDGIDDFVYHWELSVWCLYSGPYMESNGRLASFFSTRVRIRTIGKRFASNEKEMELTILLLGQSAPTTTIPVTKQLISFSKAFCPRRLFKPSAASPMSVTRLTNKTSPSFIGLLCWDVTHF